VLPARLGPLVVMAAVAQMGREVQGKLGRLGRLDLEGRLGRLVQQARPVP